MTTNWADVMAQALEPMRGELSIADGLDELANLVFYRWVDEQAETDGAFSARIFPSQARRYRWKAALGYPPKDFGTFLYDEVYPYLGSLDRVAPDVALFFRFVESRRVGVGLRSAAEAVGQLNLGALGPESADSLVDALAPADRMAHAVTTHESVRRLISQAAELHEGATVLDLACGTGGLLHGISGRASRLNLRLGKCVGVEIRPRGLRYARLRFALSRLAVPDLRLGDALGTELVLDEKEKFDIVVCDPPLGLASSRPVRRFETPSRNLEHMFLQLSMEALKPSGLGFILIPPAMFSAGRARELREALFERFLPEAVFALPRGAIPETSIQPYLFALRPRGTTRGSENPLFIPFREGETVEEYGERAAVLWRERSATPAGTQAVDLQTIRQWDYDITRFQRRQTMPRVRPPSIASAMAGLDETWTALRQRLSQLAGLVVSPGMRRPLGELLRRARSERAPVPRPWLLTLNQIEPHTGRVLDRRHGSAGQSASSGMVAFERGDLLYSRLNPHLAKCCIADESGFCVSDIIPFRVNEDIVRPAFLAYAMRSPEFTNAAAESSGGVTHSRISTEALLALKILLPPLESQDAVVAALADADAAVADAHRILNTASLVRQTALSRLLDGDDQE